MPQHYGNKKKRRSGDPNLEPGVAAATKRAQRTRKAAPTKKSQQIIPKIRDFAHFSRQIKKLMKQAEASTASKRNRTAEGRKRTSDPNLEPGVAAATRRSQRSPRKKFKKMEAIENRLVPNIGTPVPRRGVPEFPPAIGTDFPYGRPVTPKPTRNRTGTTKRRRR